MKVYSVADVKNGFWHVRLDKESSDLTTFATPFGRYKWLRLPFGLAPAPEVFQRKLHTAIEGLDGVWAIARMIFLLQARVTLTMKQGRTTIGI